MTIHNLLLHSGFRYIESRYITDVPITLPRESPVYLKTYQTQAGEFVIAVINPDEDLSHLPEIYVLKRPIELVGIALPHISSFQRLCLVNQDTSDWDPQHPMSVISMLDSLIQKALDNAVTAGHERHEEFQTEFVNYWNGVVDAYIYGEPGKLLGEKFSYRTLNVVTWLDCKSEKEYVVFQNIEQRDNWLKLRGDKSYIGNDGDVTVVRVSRTAISPKGGHRNHFETFLIG